MNSEALADVRFGAHSGLKSDIARGPKSAAEAMVGSSRDTSALPLKADIHREIRHV
jgi:hypothetical protein